MALISLPTTDTSDDDELMTPSKPVGAWLSAIKGAQRDMDEWNKRCDKIRRRYRYESSQKIRRRQFQMLWSNIELLRPAVYAKPPKPVVEERFKSDSPIARIASQVLERNLNFQSDFKNYDRTFGMVRDDFLLYGRGVPRLRYYPVFEEADVQDPLGSPADAEGYENDNSEPPETPGLGDPSDTDDNPEQVLKLENVCVDFVQRSDFIHPFVRIWEELPWLVYRAFLTRAELRERFKGRGPANQLIANLIPLDSKGNTGELNETDGNRKESAEDKATIYEIWDKVNNQVLWIAAGYQDVIEVSKPYLLFKSFFPSPRPAYGTITTDSLIPVPDYTYYQDQAQEIDDLTARIASLSDSLKLVGFYPAGPQGEGQPEIERAVRPGIENKMIAVKSWDAFKAAGGGGAPIVWLPVEVVEQLLRGCVELRKQLIDDVYQITGISDILRGASEATETLGAQQLKAQWGSVRMRERQAEIARMCRDTTSMVAEIMCNQFQVTTLLECADMTLPTKAQVEQSALQASLAQQAWQEASQAAQIAGQQPPPAPPPVPDFGPTVEDLDAFLKNKVAVAFKVDIEVDSTINSDESQEKQDRVEFLQATSQFIAQWGPMVQQQPALAPLAGELLLFGVKSFRTARQLEGTVEQYVKQLEQMAAQPPPEPPPDPVAQAKLQQVQMEGENSKQLHDQTMQQNQQKHEQALQQQDQKHQETMAQIQAKGVSDAAAAAVTEHQKTAEHNRALALHDKQMEAADHATSLREREHSAKADAAKTAAGAKMAAARAKKGEPPTPEDGENSSDPLAEATKRAADAQQQQADALKAVVEALIASGESQKEANATIAALLAKPKTLVIKKRGPDNRINEAEVS